MLSNRKGRKEGTEFAVGGALRALRLCERSKGKSSTLGTRELSFFYPYPRVNES